ncbi:hypothetical protein DPMN_091519 [Dreissena polymorpha]|uniref:Uncharacterized protein n=1 Tax=Dreissena polymorpha TaxID=45954 RepID=A0A9D4L0M8_DREPO|nr:hypothetical protein DPMN_091519 [Dreissena polymorpha]
MVRLSRLWKKTVPSGSTSPSYSSSYSTFARPGRFTRTQKAGYRLLNINVSEDCPSSPVRSTRPTCTSGT